MKPIKIAAIIAIAGLFLVACSEQNPITTGQVQQTESQAPAQVAETAPQEPAEFDGTLTQTEKGLALITDTDIYVVMGQDLSDMLGKKVKVIGAIAEVEETQVIQVMSVVPIE